MKTFKNTFKGLVFIAGIFLFISCSDDPTSNTENSENLEFQKNSRATELMGYVITKDNEPVEGARIKLRGQTISATNADGSFNLEGVQLRTGDVLTFEHRDYLAVTKIVRDDMKLLVSMKKRGRTVRIDSRSTNEIEVGPGGRIVIPENSLGQNGQVYTGMIDVQVTYIDVTDSFDLRSAPGSYVAQGREGLYPLTSFGMIEIVATIPGEGIRLDVVRESSITVEFPLLNPRETPETVNLYAFDMETGYWELEGELVNTGSVLLGEVTSINSAWNADEPCGEALICVKIKVVFTNGNPGCGVAAEGLSYQGFDGLHSIGADDYVYLMVCPDSSFELQSCFPLCIPCPGPLYTTMIDLTTVTTPPGPDGCIDLGAWIIVN